MFARRKFSPTFINFLKGAKINIYDKGILINVLELFSFEEIRPIDIVANLLLHMYVRFNCNNDKVSFVPDNLMLKYFGEKFLLLPNNIPVKYLKELTIQETIVDGTTRSSNGSCSQLLDVLKCLSSYPINNKNIDIFRFILDPNHKKHKKEFCMLLQKHPLANKLCFSVIFNKKDEVQEYIKSCNPCNNYYRAYRLAKVRNQEEIVNTILNTIINLLVLYKQVLIYMNCNEDIIHNILRIL